MVRKAHHERLNIKLILIVRSILPKVRGIVVNVSICHGNTDQHNENRTGRRHSAAISADGEDDDHTVIEFDQEPALAWLAPPIISITDEDNRAVSYERVGRFYRLNRKYDYFKLRVNGRLTAFFAHNNPIPTTPIKQNPSANLGPKNIRDPVIF